MKPTLGFIGLGAMGSRIARRLLDAGYAPGVREIGAETGLSPGTVKHLGFLLLTLAREPRSGGGREAQRPPSEFVVAAPT